MLVTGWAGARCASALFFWRVPKLGRAGFWGRKAGPDHFVVHPTHPLSPGGPLARPGSRGGEGRGQGPGEAWPLAWTHLHSGHKPRIYKGRWVRPVGREKVDPPKLANSKMVYGPTFGGSVQLAQLCFKI